MIMYFYFNKSVLLKFQAALMLGVHKQQPHKAQLVVLLLLRRPRVLSYAIQV